MKRILILIILSLFLVDIASAATVHGTVYDFSLEKIKNVIVEINTNPAQRQIAKEGTYIFNIPRGSYTITAKKIDNKIITTENITIIEEGNYTLDLIAFLDIEEEEELLNDTELDIGTDIEELEEKNNAWMITLLIILIVIIAALVYFKFNEKPQHKKTKEVKVEETDLANKILDIIRKEGGRTTQKELRKLLPYSEAKISLIITELESKGKVEKIKKGRSNVIILKK